MTSTVKNVLVVALHAMVPLALYFTYPWISEYHQNNLGRILILAIYASGYNLLLGYTGLLSLGHALYLAAGLYGAGLATTVLGFGTLGAFLIGVLSATLLASLVGALALRTTGVAFMIVTLMFSQAGYLTILYFNRITRGDEGFVVPRGDSIGGLPADIGNADTRFIIALILFAVCTALALLLVQSNVGRVWRALADNEERVELLGYSPTHYKFLAFVLSGLMAGVAGAAYALMFAYVGASFATIQYSIFALLWVLVGGAGVVLGPLLGTGIMFYLVDYISELTSAWLMFVGIALIILVMVAPRGVLGTLRHKLDWHWLP
ncbi:MAG: branched-chain amino acid ABC transporter permease [Granulosicoccus sp.]